MAKYIVRVTVTTSAKARKPNVKEWVQACLDQRADMSVGDAEVRTAKASTVDEQ
jgi:hypothetical protein